MSCPKCGHEINMEHFPLGLIFCPYCSQKIHDQEPFQVIPFCPQCGCRLLTEVTFCPECGQRVTPEPVAPPVVAANETVLTLSAGPEMPPSAETAIPEVVKESPASRIRVVWPQAGAALKRVSKSVTGIFTSQGRLKKLYEDWAAHDGLPADEIPADESLKRLAQTAAPPAEPKRRAVPVWIVALAALGLILLFVGIGLLMRQPAPAKPFITPGVIALFISA